MTSSHSFHSLEAQKEPISFTFGHTQTDMIETESHPPTISPGVSFIYMVTIIKGDTDGSGLRGGEGLGPVLVRVPSDRGTA